MAPKLGLSVTDYRSLQRLIPWLLVGYVLVALAVIPTRRHEVIPFFCWFLFPITPNVEERYQLWITQNAGRRLPQATAFERAAAFVGQPHSMDAYVGIQTMGKAFRQHDGTMFERARQTVEANFLQAPCGYQLVYLRQDAYEIWHGGLPETRRILASFQCETPGAPLRSEWP